MTKRLKKIMCFLSDLDINFKVADWYNGRGKDIEINDNIIISVPDDFEMTVKFENKLNEVKR